MEPNTIYNMDCLDGMKLMADSSVDMLLTDLPYGCLECKWDKPIDLPVFWEQVNRIVKENGAMVFTASFKFAVELVNSNRKFFRYDLVWEKSMSVGFANCNRMPLRKHELILVFYRRLPVYNPQGLKPVVNPKTMRKSFSDKEYVYRTSSLNKSYIQRFTNYPMSVLRFPNSNQHSIHPTQKPLTMFEYFIQTYTNPGQLVLDCCMGSGTTAVAARNTGRRYIGFETDAKYFEAANKRILEA